VNQHSCPRCCAIGDNFDIIEFGKGDTWCYSLKCKKCGYESSSYTSPEKLDIIWPKNATLMEIFDRVSRTLAKAEKKHPNFAEGQYEALGYLGEEYGEVTKEITKGKEGWEKRMDAEIYDLIAVAIRILRREYEHDTH